MKRYLKRYTDSERMNHWFIAFLFFAAGLSGMALFHPAFYFLSNLFGGGSWTRILHPFLGSLMFLCFLIFALRVMKHNFIDANDRKWRGQMGEMLRGQKENMPPIGKYNYGQKLVFWLMVLSLIVLVVTGVMFWRPWFDGYFSIGLQRLAVVLHATSAFVLSLTVLVHIYAAFWVKGTTRAMTRGTVSEGWAKMHHPLWHEEVTKRS